MGRQSALIENGYVKGTREYKHYLSKMEELEFKLYQMSESGLMTYNLTHSRYFEVLNLLEDFKRDGLKFTIGHVDYIELMEFIEAAYGILSMSLIKKIIRKVTGGREINPMSYGYDSSDLSQIIEMIDDIKELVEDMIK